MMSLENKMNEDKIFKLFFGELPKMISEAIDLGCGWGKIANYIPKEISLTGVDKEDFSNRRVFDSFIKCDINDFKFKKNYDLIISSRTLHLVDNPKEVIGKIQSNTPPNGYNLLIGLGNKKPGQKEIREWYKDGKWRMEESIEFLSDYNDHKGKSRPHRHELFLLFYKKASNDAHLDIKNK